MVPHISSLPYIDLSSAPAARGAEAGASLASGLPRSRPHGASHFPLLLQGISQVKQSLARSISTLDAALEGLVRRLQATPACSGDIGREGGRLSSPSELVSELLEFTRSWEGLDAGRDIDALNLPQKLKLRISVNEPAPSSLNEAADACRRPHAGKVIVSADFASNLVAQLDDAQELVHRIQSAIDGDCERPAAAA